MHNAKDLTGLGDSLMQLHLSVSKLIKVIQINSATIDSREEILDKLPLLDFYNDDLLRSINFMRERSP